MAAHTKIDLYQMQSLPLDAKIRMTARRIDAFIDRNDAYISISGGKDSRVLDDIERRFVRAKLPRVFIDTGLEHRSVRACGKRHADIILRPEKNFKQIITEYGYPVISKEVAQTIAEARKGLKHGNCYTYRMAKLNGTAVDKNGDKSKYNIPQYKFLLDAPFRISHKCCCIYSYYGKIRINSDGKDGKEIDVEALGYLEGYQEHKEESGAGE